MIETLLDNILKHDRIVIITDLYSKESLDKLLKMIMNYVGEDDYIEHTDEYMFDVFLDAFKYKQKRIISTTLNVWLTNTGITDRTFSDVRFILPYKNLLRMSALQLPNNMTSIPTRLMYMADLILSIDDNKLTVQKIRSAEFLNSTSIDLKELFLDERNLKIKRLRKLIT